jgi:transposase, IS4 family
MAFTRIKTINGNQYRYEISTYRDPNTGKVKHRSRYLGKVSTEFDFGDVVSFTLLLNGKPQRLQGLIVPGFTQIPGCRWPRVGDEEVELLTVPYQPPGTVTVAWRWKELEGVVQLPPTRLKKLKPSAPPDPPKLPDLPDWLKAHLQVWNQ